MTLTPTTRPGPGHRAARRGFSLVEVLMAVLILSLGLLGLGAIMPAVVKQQRVGADQTFGTIAARTVAANIKGNGLFNGRAAGSGNALLRSYGRWEAWARCTASAGYSYDIPEDGTWRVLEVEGDSSGIGTGRAVLGPFGPDITGDDAAYINLQDRLFPSPTSVTTGAALVSEPQFVVDLAVRRVTPLIDSGPMNQMGTGGALLYERPGNFTVQVALITRRVDQRIRSADGVSIMQALTDTSLPLSSRRWPVSEDATGNPMGGGENQGPGSPRYSLPYTVSVTYDPATPDQLIVETADDSQHASSPTTRTAQVAFQQLSQPGQIIIDNLGNIYTVQGTDDRAASNALALRISPSVAGNIPASSSSDRRRLHQVLVSPQAPAAVNIITVNP
ncbi:MAG TPA: prepilin-type N-terminal cleavage/methylation domain-containing protein [Phycisphaerales bacterium]|nr:prepilin-type N-terminal cleavage/methylation domain-containing protein [Phycisphaerales bacterium]